MAAGKDADFGGVLDAIGGAVRRQLLTALCELGRAHVTMLCQLTRLPRTVVGHHLKDLKLRWDPHGGRGYVHRRSNATVCKFLDVSEGTEGSHECPDLPVVEGDVFFPPFEDHFEVAAEILDCREFTILHYRNRAFEA